MLWCDVYIVVKRGTGRGGSGEGITLSKATASKPTLAKDEIAFKLRVQVPDDAFDHTLPEAVIQMTNDQKMTPDIQVLVDGAAQQIVEDIASVK